MNLSSPHGLRISRRRVPHSKKCGTRRRNLMRHIIPKPWPWELVQRPVDPHFVAVGSLHQRCRSRHYGPFL